MQSVSNVPEQIVLKVSGVELWPNPLKVVPWLARRAGITDERAWSCWRQAVRLAGLETGSRTNASFCRVSGERLHQLIERELRKIQAVI
jgi:hypothetical protein